MTDLELQQLVESEIQEALVGASEVIKQYVDERDAATAEELKQVIVEELSGVEGLADNLTKLQELADAFVSVFDSDGDGTITAEEIIAKISLIQSNIDKIASDLANVDSKYQSITDALNSSINDLTSRVGAAEVNIAKNTDEIAAVKADLATNYFTRDEVANALTIETQKVVDAVKNVFYPNTEDGDGATL